MSDKGFVWGIEIACDNGKRWELIFHYRTKKAALSRMNYERQPLPRRTYRIRKYVRQP